MPSLIVDYQGSRRASVIPQRVLIGRLPTLGISLPESQVSRLHAWIENIDGQCHVADLGSLTGTAVNDQRIEKRRLLNDNDVLHVGGATIIYRTSDELPYGIAPMDLNGTAPSTDVATAGILFDCPCGAPHWVRPSAAGHKAQCHRCGNQIVIPAVPGARAALVAVGPAAVPSEISPGYLDEPRISDASETAQTHRAVPITREKSSAHLPDPAPRQMSETPRAPITGPEPGIMARADAAHVEGWQTADMDDGLAEFEASDATASPDIETPASLEAPSPSDATDNPPVDSQDTGPALGAEISEPSAVPDPPVSEGENRIHTEADLEFIDGADDDTAPSLPLGDDEHLISDPHSATAKDGAATMPSLADSTLAASGLTDPANAASDESPSSPLEPCSICHSAIVADEPTHTCPDCGLTFHVECWNENRGCSAYGCAQVGALDPAVDSSLTLDGDLASAAQLDAQGELPMDPAAYAGSGDLAGGVGGAGEEEAPPTHWDAMFLMASVIGAFLSVITFGIPSLVTTLGTGVYVLAIRGKQRRGLAMFALVLGILGIIAGAATSRYWFFVVNHKRWVWH